MVSPLTVLSFTCSEYGQANVHLATSYELALAGANVHIASFPSLAPRVSSLQDLVSRHASRSGIPSPGSVCFHECKGIPSFWDALKMHGLNDATIMHPHGISGALQFYPRLAFVLFPWNHEEHLTAIERLKEIIAEIKPDVVVVDPLFSPGKDACELMGQKYMNLLPTSPSGEVIGHQPYLAALWKFPALASGFPFPIKWWQIPINVYLFFRLVTQMITSKHVREVKTMQKSLGVKSRPSGGFRAKFISPSLPEIDWPFEVIPEHVILCGPIVMPFEPLEEKDLSLMKWLNNGPTVMVNLGSHTVSDVKVAKEMTGAFRILLDHYDQKNAGKIQQILWKVRPNGDIEKVIHDAVGNEIIAGTVKVMAWLEADPISILQHPNVVCTVHHGGANSFYEGIWSGVPQVVLPVWIDTYDYATQAEYLNVGVFANKSCSPGVRAEEFGKALVRVAGKTEEAGKFRSAAKRLKEICRAKGNGREMASMVILNEARTTSWQDAARKS